MTKFLPYLVVLLFAASCGKLGLYSAKEGEKVASVGKFTLYENDLSEYLSGVKFSSDSDSISLRAAYVDAWVKSRVMQTVAAENISSLSEIEEMVENYRSQLILYDFENSYIRSRMDTVVDSVAVEKYYKEHISSFRLQLPLIKCTVARIPAGVRQSEKLQNLFLSRDREDVFEFMEICDKNGYMTYDHTQKWIDLSELSKIVPFSMQKADFYFWDKRSYTADDDAWHYMVKIADYLPSGSYIPIEREASNIKKILINERRTQIRRHLEDSILNSAYANGIVQRL